jgi:hypothetical protein
VNLHLPASLFLFSIVGSINLRGIDVSPSTYMVEELVLSASVTMVHRCTALHQDLYLQIHHID